MNDPFPEKTPVLRHQLTATSVYRSPAIQSTRAKLCLIESTRRDAVPWWLWWNILALDAPMVAVLWQLWIVRQSGIHIAITETVVLGLVVWLIYMIDHMLDGWLLTSSLHDRHIFCLHHRSPLAIVLFLTLTAIFWLSTEHLPYREIRAGLVLFAIVILYLVCVHALRSLARISVIKELSVGFTFAAGVTLPCWSGIEGLSNYCLAAFVVFGLLCTLNCLMIECREAGRSTLPVKSELRDVRTSSWIRPHLDQIAASLAVIAFGAFLLGFHRREARLFATMCSAAVLLFYLSRKEARLSADGFRVLADLALLIPAAVALLTIR